MQFCQRISSANLRITSRTMPVLIRIVAAANEQNHEALKRHYGRFLAAYRPHAFGRGRYVADIDTTDDIAEAMTFRSLGDAARFWRQESGVPRPDGQPNRPLCAFTVETVTLDG